MSALGGRSRELLRILLKPSERSSWVVDANRGAEGCGKLVRLSSIAFGADFCGFAVGGEEDSALITVAAENGLDRSFRIHVDGCLKRIIILTNTWTRLSFSIGLDDLVMLVKRALLTSIEKYPKSILLVQLGPKVLVKHYP